MIRRNTSEEAGARSDGLMIVSVLFIAAFTFIAFTTNPVYTGIDVGDRVPELKGKMTTDGVTWVDFDLADYYDEMWAEGDEGTWTMIEFMDTNCGACVNSAPDITDMQQMWLGDNPQRPLAENITVEFVAISISLWTEDTPGKSYGKDEIVSFKDKYSHTFGYVDMQDNSHQDKWGNFGTPTYFLVNPNGIIEFATPSADYGYSIWDAMQEKIPRGDQ